MGQQVRREFSDDFKREAVRLTETSGRTIKQVADDLGVGLSTLTNSEDPIPQQTRAGISMRSSSRSMARPCIYGALWIVKARFWTSWCNPDATRGRH